MNGQGVLREAEVLVAEGWCSGADARDGAGAAVAALDPAATCWSLPGALAVVAGMPGVDLDSLAVALTGLASVISEDSLSEWNDRPGRTQAQTLEALSAARRSLDDRPPELITLSLN